MGISTFVGWAFSGLSIRLGGAAAAIWVGASAAHTVLDTFGSVSRAFPH